LRAHLDQRVTGRFEFRLSECAVGMTAAARGDWVAAEQHFKNTREFAEPLPHLVEQAYTRQAWAEALLRRASRRTASGLSRCFARPPSDTRTWAWSATWRSPGLDRRGLTAKLPLAHLAHLAS
jgi:hypothetical protein